MTLYQQDPACIDRLMFYTCDAVDAGTPNNDTTNPTMASDSLTGAFDSCTVAIEAERPSHCMPADVCSPVRQANAWAPGQASADNPSWQLFIAINWPADPNTPGYPDTSKQLGALATSGTGHARAVWLDYPTPEDLFGVPPPCPGLTLKTTAKFSDVFLSKEYPPAALGGVVQPGGGVLVDQNQNVVYTDIRVNRTEWEFIVNQNSYWQTGASLTAIPQNLTRDYSVAPGMTMREFPAALPLLPESQALPQRCGHPSGYEAGADAGDTPDEPDGVDDPADAVHRALRQRHHQVLRRRQRVEELLPGECAMAAQGLVDQPSGLPAIVRGEPPVSAAQRDAGDLQRRALGARHERLQCQQFGLQDLQRRLRRPARRWGRVP
jgi:hypothetical protein